MYYLHRGHAALRYKTEGQLLVLMNDYTISPNITPIYSARPGPTPQYSADYSGYCLFNRLKIYVKLNCTQQDKHTYVGKSISKLKIQVVT